MYTNPSEIRKKHDGRIKTLWEIYQADGKLAKNKLFQWTFSLVTVYVLLSLFTNLEAYNLLMDDVQIALGVLPNLLGFNLGAYILIVGFGSTEILQVITRPLKGVKDFSLYQKLNGVFGTSVLVQAIALIAVFTLTLWDKIQDSFVWQPSGGAQLLAIKFVNLIALHLTTLIVAYSFVLLINVTKHVFLFAQTIHFVIYHQLLKKVQHEQEERNVDQNEKKCE